MAEEKTEVHVNLTFKGKMATKFAALKQHLGVTNNTEVVRIVVSNEYARIIKETER